MSVPLCGEAYSDTANYLQTVCLSLYRTGFNWGALKPGRKKELEGTGFLLSTLILYHRTMRLSRGF